jgi:retron-type reverse transcriptase
LCVKGIFAQDLGLVLGPFCFNATKPGMVKSLRSSSWISFLRPARTALSSPSGPSPSLLSETRGFSQIPFERYANDGICHCQSKAQAESLRAAIEQRFAECGLELHRQKTRIIYCKDDRRREEWIIPFPAWNTG